MPRLQRLSDRRRLNINLTRKSGIDVESTSILGSLLSEVRCSQLVGGYWKTGTHCSLCLWYITVTSRRLKSAETPLLVQHLVHANNNGYTKPSHHWRFVRGINQWWCTITIIWNAFRYHDDVFSLPISAYHYFIWIQMTVSSCGISVAWRNHYFTSYVWDNACHSVVIA